MGRLSHRRSKKDQLKALRSEPVVCRRCGSTEILYGNKRGLCKKCRTIVRKPKGGWYDANGDKITIIIFVCNKCDKMFSRKRSKDMALPDVCPKCGGTDLKEVDRW